MPTHDIDARGIARTGAAIALVVASAVVFVFALLRYWDIPPGGNRDRLPEALAIEGAGLQSAPQQDIARYRAEKQRLLESGGWVDVPGGIVRIPLSSAMELLVRDARSAASAPQEAR